MNSLALCLLRSVRRRTVSPLTIAVAAILALCAPARADPAIHYAPAENLEHVDVALIDTARQEIDLAAYILTDWPVIQALTRAADRGAKVRIYLDGDIRQTQPLR